MFREAALILTALTSLTIADANAGSAVVLSSMAITPLLGDNF
jgi:hypothetical protein